MRFIITIDTEGDNQWDHGRELTVENIRFIPRFQDLCMKYGIKPTYLVTSEVCDDDYAKELFSRYVRDDLAEIGAHLHSWTTPPFLDKDGYRENDPNHTFASELPIELLDEKITTLSEQIRKSFGSTPTSFRSGRYGFTRDVARSLIKNSYIVDSSVTPFVSWQSHKGLPNGEGGPDFIDASVYPYRYEVDGDSIIELPITILPTRAPLSGNYRLAAFYFRNVSSNIILRGARKLFYSNQPVWLRPVPGTDINLFKVLINETIRKNLPFITMMFHSSELMPGCSKYRPDSDSVEELYRLLECFFQFLSENLIASATLTESAKIYRNEDMFLG